MLKTIRVMLIPNNKQKTKLFRYANTSRFAYNWALGREKENYKNSGKFLSDGDLRKEFTQLQKTEEYFPVCTLLSDGAWHDGETVPV